MGMAGGCPGIGVSFESCAYYDTNLYRTSNNVLVRTEASVIRIC